VSTQDLYVLPSAQDWSVEAAGETRFSWEYGDSREKLLALYQKGKDKQWDSEKRIDWDLEVDPYDVLGLPDETIAIYGTRYWDAMSERERKDLRRHFASWQFSQFLHGEQGAMIVASQLVGGVPWIEAKYYASSQTMDEARHVEVFSRYLRDKLEWQWPVNENLKELLDATITDGRWDFKYLGMQIIIEGLAMAAFGNMFQITQEPLLKELVRYVMKDESRHVAFGMLSLAEFYRDMPPAELRDREGFIIYACELMRNRLVGDQISSAMGWDREEVKRVVLDSAPAQMFRRMLFARVVPNLRRLGLLTPRVREAFAGLGILEFEHADPEAQDRALGLA